MELAQEGPRAVAAPASAFVSDLLLCVAAPGAHAGGQPNSPLSINTLYEDDDPRTNQLVEEAMQQEGQTADIDSIVNRVKRLNLGLPAEDDLTRYGGSQPRRGFQYHYPMY